jgi:hypothetical protein
MTYKLEDTRRSLVIILIYNILLTVRFEMEPYDESTLVDT